MSEQLTPRQLANQALGKATSKGTMSGLKSTDVQTVLESMRLQIAQALPKHLTPDRMIQVATNLISRNPNIANCSVSSLIGAVMQASILGFEPVDSLGYCYFVPYGGHVQFQIGYRGYVSLARRSGEIKTIYSYVVHDGDHFEYSLGLEPKIDHVPVKDSGPITHVYAVVHYKDGGYNFIVLTREQVEKLRLRSPSQKKGLSGAWFTDYDAMAMAKAIKQMSKWMPLTTELQTAVNSDEAIIKVDDFSKDGTGVTGDLEYPTYDETAETVAEVISTVSKEAEPVEEAAAEIAETPTEVVDEKSKVEKPKRGTPKNTEFQNPKDEKLF